MQKAGLIRRILHQNYNNDCSLFTSLSTLIHAARLVG